MVVVVRIVMQLKHDVPNPTPPSLRTPPASTALSMLAMSMRATGTAVPRGWGGT